jgi:hypothetical protein
MMPSDVQDRIRRRVMGEITQTPRPAWRTAGQFTVAQVCLLLLALLTLAWTVQGSVLPTLRSLWERSHCAPEVRK